MMARLGHSTTAAAIRHQRAAETRDLELADRLDGLVVDLAERRRRRDLPAVATDRAGFSRNEQAPFVLPARLSGPAMTLTPKSGPRL